MISIISTFLSLLTTFVINLLYLKYILKLKMITDQQPLPMQSQSKWLLSSGRIATYKQDDPNI